jgi:hypothetical protein
MSNTELVKLRCLQRKIYGTPSQRESRSPFQIETERNFRINLRSKKEAENNKIEEDFLLLSNETRLKLNDIQGKDESS